MDEKKGGFPEIRKSICDFITEEEGSISRNKVIAVGALMLVMSTLMAPHVYAGHSSHRSHSSHSSHSSGSHSSGHSSHVSHSSHSSGYHSSHSSHSNHSNHSSHSSNVHSNHASHSSNTHANTTHSNSAGTHSNSSAAVQTSSHNNTAGIITPTFTAPKLYDLSAIHNKLLGVHSTSSSAAVANLKITDFDD